MIGIFEDHLKDKVADASPSTFSFLDQEMNKSFDKGITSTPRPTSTISISILDLPDVPLIRILKYCDHDAVAEFTRISHQAHSFVQNNKRFICNRFIRGVLYHEKIMGVKGKYFETKAHRCLSLNDQRLRYAHFDDLVIMFPPDQSIDFDFPLIAINWRVDKLVVRLCHANSSNTIRQGIYKAVNTLKHNELVIFHRIDEKYEMILNMKPIECKGVLLSNVMQQFDEIFIKISCDNEEVEDRFLSALHNGRISVFSKDHFEVKLVVKCIDDEQRDRLIEKLNEHEKEIECTECRSKIYFPSTDLFGL